MEREKGKGVGMEAGSRERDCRREKMLTEGMGGRQKERRGKRGAEGGRETGN